MEKKANNAQGLLLVAAPALKDPNFFHAVVLMVQHNDEGALGLVLNRPLETTVVEAWEQVNDDGCSVEGVLYQGGPCDGPLMVVHTDYSLSEVEVRPGLYFSTQRDAVERLVSLNNTPMRFFVGYAGWGPGQLEAELAEGAWLAVQASGEAVFADPSQLWKGVMEAVSRAAIESVVKPQAMPDDPSLN